MKRSNKLSIAINAGARKNRPFTCPSSTKLLRGSGVVISSDEGDSLPRVQKMSRFALSNIPRKFGAPTCPADYCQLTLLFTHLPSQYVAADSSKNRKEAEGTRLDYARHCGVEPTNSKLRKMFRLIACIMH